MTKEVTKKPPIIIDPKIGQETVGKVSLDLSQKDPYSRDPIELQREMHKDYVSNVIECINRSKKDFPNDFFVVVITKKERLMPNVLRNYFTARLTCPTPEYDQTVYKYLSKREDLEYLWTIPSKDTVSLLINNALEVSPEERELLMHALSFTDGTYFRKAKELNGEADDSILIKK